MLKHIKKIFTADEAGQVNYDFPNYITGKFLGLHISLGTMTDFGVQIAARNDDFSLSRTVYSANNPGETNFLPIKKQVVDASGNLITGEYEHYLFLDEKLRINLYDANEGETVEFTFLFDMEKQTANHQ
jgi:hypothetical protein